MAQGVSDFITAKMRGKGQERTVIIPVTAPLEKVRISPGAVAKFYAIHAIYQKMLTEEGAPSIVEASKEFYTWMVHRPEEDVTRDFYLPKQSENSGVETNVDELEERLSGGMEVFKERGNAELYGWSHLHPHEQGYSLAVAVGPSSTDKQNNPKVLAMVSSKLGNQLEGYDITKMPSLVQSLHEDVLGLEDKASQNSYKIHIDMDGLAGAVARKLEASGVRIDSEKVDVEDLLRAALADGNAVSMLEDYSPVRVVYSKSLIFNCAKSPKEFVSRFSGANGEIDNAFCYAEIFGNTVDSAGRAVPNSYFCLEVPVQITAVENDFEVTPEGTLAPKYLPELERLVRQQIILDPRLRNARAVEEQMRRGRQQPVIQEPRIVEQPASGVLTPVTVELPAMTAPEHLSVWQKFVQWLYQVAMPHQQAYQQPTGLVTPDPSAAQAVSAPTESDLEKKADGSTDQS